MTYKENQDKWLEKHDVKIGDEVMVMAMAQYGEKGWGDKWVGDMSELIGHIGKVLGFDDSFGISVFFGDESWSFPYFVLKPIREVQVDAPESVVEQSDNPSTELSANDAIVRQIVTYFMYSLNIDKSLVKDVHIVYIDNRVCVVNITSNTGRIFVGSAVRRSNEPQKPFTGMMLAMDRAFEQLELETRWR